MKKIANLLLTSGILSLSFSIYAQNEIHATYLAGDSGAQFCAQDRFKNDKTCIAGLNNTTTVTLRFKTDNWGQIDVPPHNVAVLAIQNETYANIHFVVSNPKTGKLIYDGPAANKVGISCTAAGCVPWK